MSAILLLTDGHDTLFRAGLSQHLYWGGGVCPTLGFIVSLKWIEYGVYGDVTVRYPKPFSMYLRGTIGFKVQGLAVGYRMS